MADVSGAAPSLGDPTRIERGSPLYLAGVCLVATAFFQRFVPETKGKTLEEIEAYWRA
jgi:hypothetical protein